MNAPSGQPAREPSWFVKSLGIGIAAGILGLLLRYWPQSPITFFLCIGGVVFSAIYLCYNPAYWLRRLSTGSLGLAAASGSIPTIAGWLDVPVTSKFASGGFIVDNSPTFAGICVFASVAFAILDVIVNSPRPTKTPSPDTAGIGLTSISTSGPNSPIAGGNQKIKNQSDVAGGNLAKTDGGDAAARDIVHHHHTDQETINRMIQLAKENGILTSGLQTANETIQQKDSQIQTLQAALDRLGESADAGNEQARRALAEARATGDAEDLQAALIALANKQEAMASDAAADYVELCREIAEVAYLLGDIQEAERRLNSILKFIPDDLDAFNRLGRIAHLTGDLPEAEARFHRVIQLSKDDHWRAIGYGNLGLIYQTRGDLDQAEAMHKKALAIDEKLGCLQGMAPNYSCLGLVSQTRGDLDQAEILHKKALTINEKLGHLEGMASDYSNLGMVHQRRGDLDQAEVFYNKALAINQKLGRREGMASNYGNLGIIFKERGNLDQADIIYKKALALNEGLGRLEGVARQWVNLGFICKIRRDKEGARELWTKARDIFKQVGMKSEVAKVQKLLDSLDEPKP